MAITYTINFTDDSDKSPFTILPLGTNGPTGVLRTLDLELVGMGTAIWGEKMEENLVHLLENFSSPEITPGVPDPAYTYAPITPTRGQLWHNSTHDKLFSWSGTEWVQFLSRDASGDLDMEGFRILNLAQPAAPTGPDTPVDPDQAATTQYVHNIFVDEAGDSMTGDLTMTGGSEVLGLPATPSGITAATSMLYVDTQDDLKYDKTGGLISGNVTVDGDITFSDNVVSKLSAPAASNTYLEFDITGTTRNVKLVTNTLTAIGINATTGGISSIDAFAELDMNTNKIINVVDPTNAQDAATRAYVLSQVASGTSIVDESLFQNGYIHFSNGLVILWGKTYMTAGAALTGQPLPITLDTTYTLTAGYESATRGAGQYDGWGAIYTSTSTFSIFNDMDLARNISWIGTGHKAVI